MSKVLDSTSPLLIIRSILGEGRGLERIHQSRKTMMSTYCYQYSKDCDQRVHIALFAAQEAEQESIGSNFYNMENIVCKIS